MGAPKAVKTRRIDIAMAPLELWDHVEKTPAPDAAEYVADGSEAPGKKWNGFITWAQAKEYARHGWPEGLDRVAPVVARVDELIAHVVPAPVTAYDITGDAPDVGAYLAGIPENMLTTEIQEGAGRMVRILANVGASAGVNTETIEARGIIACALVDALERVGYRCEVVAVWESSTRAAGYSNVRLGVRTILKRAEEPLSLDRLTFAMIHPAFLRRIMFRVLELITPASDRDAFMHHNYGYPAPVIGAPGDVVIGELYGTDWTPERMAQEVGRYLREVGVHMTGAGVDGEEVAA